MRVRNECVFVHTCACACVCACACSGVRFRWGTNKHSSNAAIASISTSASVRALTSMAISEPAKAAHMTSAPSGAPVGKLMWSDVGEDDEMPIAELQPPPSHVRDSYMPLCLQM